ncbi:hypothetical protein MN608_11453 [Microdochium nivale]|nr:hypothetical protein MN608_11453 [Microdochium nivale]
MHISATILRLVCLAATAVLATATTTPATTQSPTTTPALLPSGASVAETTITTFGSTLSGSLAVYGCATILANAQSVYVLDPTGISGIDRAGEMVVNGLTVASGTPTGSYSCAVQTSSTTAATSSRSAETTGSAPTSKPPNEGERMFGAVQIVGWAGIAIGAAAYVNA